MVIKYLSNTTDPPTLIYSGKNRAENDPLIRWGWPEDVWFHADKLPSGHIYLRLNEGMTIDTIPPELIEECGQLVKNSSVKTATMWEGQVTFKNRNVIKRMRVGEKNNEILKRLKKTKVVDNEINYHVERERRDALEKQKGKYQERIHRNKERIQNEALRRDKVAEFYDTLYGNSEKPKRTRHSSL